MLKAVAYTKAIHLHQLILWHFLQDTKIVLEKKTVFQAWILTSWMEPNTGCQEFKLSVLSVSLYCNF